MRNVKELHPELQIKLSLLQSECKKQGIVIGVGECLRTTLCMQKEERNLVR